MQRSSSDSDSDSDSESESESGSESKTWSELGSDDEDFDVSAGEDSPRSDVGEDVMTSRSAARNTTGDCSSSDGEDIRAFQAERAIAAESPAEQTAGDAMSQDSQQSQSQEWLATAADASHPDDKSAAFTASRRQGFVWVQGYSQQESEEVAAIAELSDETLEQLNKAPPATENGRVGCQCARKCFDIFQLYAKDDYDAICGCVARSC